MIANLRFLAVAFFLCAFTAVQASVQVVIVYYTLSWGIIDLQSVKIRAGWECVSASVSSNGIPWPLRRIATKWRGIVACESYDDIGISIGMRSNARYKAKPEFLWAFLVGIRTDEFAKSLRSSISRIHLKSRRNAYLSHAQSPRSSFRLFGYCSVINWMKGAATRAFKGPWSERPNSYDWRTDN
ncbi:hypothetical protein SISNIDRAFT_469803 [Sistotremastrum niveocremeum HHB9708]|uniref:Uncharacterized protein n=1 Tax=Sistotremastrum niveocremeum HHB9708 TaxID=1314777 RepID=A0A164PP31_9AGAM|nr:hypothetical protein SISNIDRAFT_469803 [Sistotremastrum niveocremeum HHB9708]